MNEKELRAKLIAAAKNNPPSDAVPYAFEKRIMNRLAECPAPNIWALWSGPLWRAALTCIAITVLCGAWSLASDRKADAAQIAAPDLESAVFAPPSQYVEDAW
jgi:hypothetical protein